MDFRLSEDQFSLIETVRDYLRDTHGPEVLRQLDGGAKRSETIWRGLVDMGLTGLLIPEADGGLGLTVVDAAQVAIECGRVCLAEPLVDNALVAVPWLLARGQTDDLPSILSGERQMALPHSINPWVADAQGAGQGEALESVDPLRCLTRAPADASDDPLLLDLGALMSAAQLIGVADAMLHQAVDYAKIRTQFGQPIGGFQALKHQLANCSVAIEFARPVLVRASVALRDGLPSASVHVSHAKLAASDAAIVTAETAIQVHGAMGYTYEVDLHFWMKRSWALAGAWGGRAFHYQRIEAAIIGGDLPLGPENTFI